MTLLVAVAVFVGLTFLASFIGHLMRCNEPPAYQPDDRADWPDDDL